MKPFARFFLPRLATALGLTGALVGCTTAPPDAPGVSTAAGAPVVGTAPATRAPVGAAQRAYLDPATGAFTSPPAGASAKAAGSDTPAPQPRYETTARGVTLMQVDLQSPLCAEKPTADAAASQVTVGECKPGAKTADKSAGGTP